MLFNLIPFFMIFINESVRQTNLKVNLIEVGVGVELGWGWGVRVVEGGREGEEGLSGRNIKLYL